VDFGLELTHVGSGYTADKLVALIRIPPSVNSQASMLGSINYRTLISKP
jgi:hypothetical protein